MPTPRTLARSRRRRAITHMRGELRIDVASRFDHSGQEMVVTPMSPSISYGALSKYSVETGEPQSTPMSRQSSP